MRFPLKRSLGNALPKLNVEGSNPFACFGPKRIGFGHLWPESEGVSNAASFDGSNSARARLGAFPPVFRTSKIEIREPRLIGLRFSSVASGRPTSPL